MKIIAVIGCIVLLASQPVCAEAERPKELSVDLGGNVNLKMVLILSGAFTMGDNHDKPAHQVSITKPFYMGKYPVTQEQWETVMGDNPGLRSKAQTRGTVGWERLSDFLAKLNAKAGGQGEKSFRLPTEAQWEYACRAGGTTKY